MGRGIEEQADEAQHASEKDAWADHRVPGLLVRTAGVKTSCETTPVGDMAVLTEGLLVREWWSL